MEIFHHCEFIENKMKFSLGIKFVFQLYISVLLPAINKVFYLCLQGIHVFFLHNSFACYMFFGFVSQQAKAGSASISIHFIRIMSVW